MERKSVKEIGSAKMCTCIVYMYPLYYRLYINKLKENIIEI